MLLQNRTVLITGASSGIGRELALLLAEKGCRLVLTGRDSARLNQVANDVSGTAIVADLASPESARALSDQVLTEHPDVSVVINNAAVQINGLFAETESNTLIQDIAFEIQVNLTAPIQLSGLLLPLLARQAEESKMPGMLVNINSGLALAPKKSAAVYCATKSGLLTFTRALRFQAEAEKKQGGADVRAVNVILPLVDTRMTAGRGSGKISAQTAAAGIIKGLEAEKNDIYIGKAGLLRILHRLLPELAGQLFRHV